MPTAGQIRGMLLEEVLLQLLRTSGYVPVEGAGIDSTLSDGPSGLEVRGRGTEHQIDAIADYRLTHPFGYRQRLLVEAKCYDTPSGIEVIRNAIGVLKDVSEYWRKGDQERFHYHYAVFSASGFTTRAQDCAFAQDVYPIPLWKSAYLRGVIDAIYNIRTRALQKMLKTRQGYFKELRAAVRHALGGHWRATPKLTELLDEYVSGDLFEEFLRMARKLSGALLAVTASGFVILLVPPNEDRNNGGLRGRVAQASAGNLRMHLRRVGTGWFWFLENAEGDRLFSLDIPPALFRKYESAAGEQRTWYQAKHNELRHLQVVWAPDGVDGPMRLEHFQLSDDWLREVHRGLERTGNL